MNHYRSVTDNPADAQRHSDDAKRLEVLIDMVGALKTHISATLPDISDDDACRAIAGAALDLQHIADLLLIEQHAREADADKAGGV